MRVFAELAESTVAAARPMASPRACGDVVSTWYGKILWSGSLGVPELAYLRL